MPKHQWIPTAEVKIGDKLACLLSDASVYPTITGWRDQEMRLSNVTHRIFEVTGDMAWWLTEGFLRHDLAGKTLIMARDEQTGKPSKSALEVTYDHPSVGIIRAERVAHASSADWNAITGSRTIGYVVDTRTDDGTEPSEVMPTDESLNVYDAFTHHGRYITSTHSLRGALAAIGNRA